MAKCLECGKDIPGKKDKVCKTCNCALNKEYYDLVQIFRREIIKK